MFVLGKLEEPHSVAYVFFRKHEPGILSEHRGESSSRFEESKYIKIITESRLKKTFSHLNRILKSPNAFVPFNGSFVEITMLEIRY